MIPDLISGLVSLVGGAGEAVGNVVSSGFDAALGALVALMTGLVASVLAGLESLLAATTTPDVSGAWFIAGPYGAAVRFGLVLLSLCAMASVGTAVRTGDPGLLGRRVLVGVPAAVIAMALTPIAMQVLLALADELSASFNAVAGNQVQSFTGGLVAGATESAGDTGGVSAAGMLGLVLSPFLLFGALAIYAVLQLRSALVLLGVALVPLALAAEVWPALEGTRRRVLRLVVGLIVAKPVIFLALAIGASAMNASNVVEPAGPPGAPGVGVQEASVLPSLFQSAGPDQAGLPEGVVDVAATAGQLVSGILVLGLAACAPLLVFRLLPGGEAAAQAAGDAAGKVGAGVSTVRSGVARVAGTAGAAGAGAAGLAGRGVQAARTAAGATAVALGLSPGAPRGGSAGGPAPVAPRPGALSGPVSSQGGPPPGGAGAGASSGVGAAPGGGGSVAGRGEPPPRKRPVPSTSGSSPVQRPASWRSKQRRSPGTS